METFDLKKLHYGAVIHQKKDYYPCLYFQESTENPNDSRKVFQIFSYHANFIAKTLKCFM